MQLLGSMAEARAMYQIQTNQSQKPALCAVPPHIRRWLTISQKKHLTPVHVHVETCDVLKQIPSLNPAAPWKKYQILNGALDICIGEATVIIGRDRGPNAMLNTRKNR